MRRRVDIGTGSRPSRSWAGAEAVRPLSTWRGGRVGGAPKSSDDVRLGAARVRAGCSLQLATAVAAGPSPASVMAVAVTERRSRSRTRPPRRQTGARHRDKPVRSRVTGVPQVADAEGLQVVRRQDRRSSSSRASRVVVGPERLGQVERRRRRRAGCSAPRAPRALRGGKMDDVIFAGTAERPALGRAEVVAHDRQHRRAAADRVHRGHDHPHAVPHRRVASTRSTACRAGCSTSRSCSPTPASAASST